MCLSHICHLFHVITMNKVNALKDHGHLSCFVALYPVVFIPYGYIEPLHMLYKYVSLNCQ